jgi:hypothetical protein
MTLMISSTAILKETAYQIASLVDVLSFDKLNNHLLSKKKECLLN